MTRTQLVIIGLTASLVVTASVVYETGKPRSDQYCDLLPCEPCDADGSNPLMADCWPSEGWLCCNDALTICGPQAEGECPGMQLWCDSYTEEADGSIECHDIFGQG